MGKVYLVGAGPGDLGLLTVRAAELLKKADCIVYDHLVNKKMLDQCKKNCEKIYVGKQNHLHTMPQDEIQKLIKQKAEVYKIVIRLKGGDPYVFGRGGEEGLYLLQNQVPFEVVPGITSAIAGLAYAGIPVTHRGVSYGFHVLSAHNKQDELAELDFEMLAKSKETLVFLMGLSKLEEIVQQLLRHGMSENKPAAVISHATLPQQRTVTAPLSSIAEEVRKQQLDSPALIAVGDVITLRTSLNVFESKPLFHTRILVPLAGEGTSKLAALLEEEGGDITTLPTSRMVECETSLSPLEWQKYQYLILTSKNSVEYLMKQMKQQKIDLRRLSHIRIAVVGKHTYDKLADYGIYADIMPERYNSESLKEILKKTVKKDDYILIPRVKGAASSICSELSEFAHVKECYLYENCMNEDLEYDALDIAAFDMIAFTCSSSVHHFMKKYSYPQISEKCRIISIGRKTTETLKSYGFSKIAEAQNSDFNSMLEKIKDVKKEMDYVL